eukprot:scaffold35665_cov112-Isochrysis_galbana.AAC.3
MPKMTAGLPSCPSGLAARSAIRMRLSGSVKTKLMAMSGVKRTTSIHLRYCVKQHTEENGGHEVEPQWVWSSIFLATDSMSYGFSPAPGSSRSSDGGGVSPTGAPVNGSVKEAMKPLKPPSRLMEKSSAGAYHVNGTIFHPMSLETAYCSRIVGRKRKKSTVPGTGLLVFLILAASTPRLIQKRRGKVKTRLKTINGVNSTVSIHLNICRGMHARLHGGHAGLPHCWLMSGGSSGPVGGLYSVPAATARLAAICRAVGFGTFGFARIPLPKLLGCAMRRRRLVQGGVTELRRCKN